MEIIKEDKLVTITKLKSPCCNAIAKEEHLKKYPIGNIHTILYCSKCGIRIFFPRKNDTLKQTIKMNKSCKCEKCRLACKKKPGWFKPGEPEKVAKHLRISLKELFNTKLMIDWWEGEKDVFIIAPAIKHGATGSEYPANPTGECIFYNNSLCEIHEVKPIECKEYICDEKEELFKIRHDKIKNIWSEKQHQQQIKDLLERIPQAESYNILNSMLW